MADALVARAPGRRCSSGRSLPALPCSDRFAAVGDGDREAGARLEDAAQPPAAEDRIHDGRDVRAPGASAAERQLVVGREDQVVPGVEERRSVVPLRLVGVHPVRAFGGHARRSVVAEIVRPHSPQRVRRQVLEPLHAALAEAHLQGVVVAASARGGRRDVGDERCGREERPALLRRRPGRQDRRRPAAAGCPRPASPDDRPCGRRIRRWPTSTR